MVPVISGLSVPALPAVTGVPNVAGMSVSRMPVTGMPVASQRVARVSTVTVSGVAVTFTTETAD